jgi:hypothetical protein
MSLHAVSFHIGEADLRDWWRILSRCKSWTRREKCNGYRGEEVETGWLCLEIDMAAFGIRTTAKCKACCVNGPSHGIFLHERKRG